MSVTSSVRTSVVVGRKGAFCDKRGNRRVSIFVAGAKSAFLVTKFMLRRQNFCVERIIVSAEFLALTFRNEIAR